MQQSKFVFSLGSVLGLNREEIRTGGGMKMGMGRGRGRNLNNNCIINTYNGEFHECKRTIRGLTIMKVAVTNKCRFVVVDIRLVLTTIIIFLC